MNNEALKKACLSATVAVAWAGSSSPALAVAPGSETVYIRTNFYHSLAVAKFVAIRDLTWMFLNLGSIPAGVSYHSIGVGLGSGSGGMMYNLVGGGPTTMPTLTYLMAMGFHDPNPGLGTPFESLFPGVSEEDAFASLMGTSASGDAPLDALISRLVANPNNNLGINEPLPYAVLHFSNGQLLGTIEASFTPIPEPAFGTFCIGLLGFGVLRARRVA